MTKNKVERPLHPPAQPTKQTWDRPRMQAFDTRAEISAYSGDRDIPWIKR